MIIREFADVLESVEESLADGVIEPVEAEQIRKEWEDLKSAGEMLVVNCEKQSGAELQPEGEEAPSKSKKKPAGGAKPKRKSRKRR